MLLPGVDVDAEQRQGFGCKGVLCVCSVVLGACGWGVRCWPARRWAWLLDVCWWLLLLPHLLCLFAGACEKLVRVSTAS